MKVSIITEMNAVKIKYVRYLVLVLIVIFFQYAGFSGKKNEIESGILSIDCDGYWHLLRVQNIHNKGNWNNDINYRGNAPFGERIHWTHAMDIVLLGGAYIGSFFSDFNSSLHWFGVIVGPLFYLLAILVIVYFGCLLLGEKYGIYPALLFAINFTQVFSVFSINRPDHHCLVSFLFTLYFFTFTLLITKPDKTLLSLAVGIAGSFALWSGLEVLILLVLSIIFLGVIWIIEGRNYIKSNFLFALSLSVFVFITVLMENKSGNFFVVSFDKISIFHVTLFFCILLYWLSVKFLTRIGVTKGIGSRFMIALGGWLFILSVCLYLFPGIFKGPFGNVDPRIHALYLDKTDEFVEKMSVILYNFLLIGPGFTFLLYSVCKKKSESRNLYFWLILLMCVYFGLGTLMSRWFITLGIISILPNALMLISMMTWKNTAKNAVFAFLIMFCLWLVPLWGAYMTVPEQQKTVNREYKFKLLEILSFLESQHRQSVPEIVLANIYIGPAIMYHTSYNVVGTANHSNEEGILDTYRILNAENDSTAKFLIDARGINYILVDDTLKYFAKISIGPNKRAENTPAKDTFIDRLTSGKIPDWISAVPLNEDLSNTFALYRISGKEK